MERTFCTVGRCGFEGVGSEQSMSYISGSFCVSMTAASGMPKLEAGPQKSAKQSSRVSTMNHCQKSEPGEAEQRRVLFSGNKEIEAAIEGCAQKGWARRLCGRSRKRSARGGVTRRTGRAEIIQRLVGADFGVDSFDCGGHDGQRKDLRGERAKVGKVRRRRCGESWKVVLGSF